MCSLHSHPRGEEFSCFQFLLSQCDQTINKASDRPWRDPGLGCPCAPIPDFSGPLFTGSCSSPLPPLSSPVGHILCIPLLHKVTGLLLFPTKEDMAAAQGQRFQEPQVLSFVGCVTGVCLHSDVSLGLAGKTSLPIQLEVSRGGQIHPRSPQGLLWGSTLCRHPISVLFPAPGRER